MMPHPTPPQQPEPEPVIYKAGSNRFGVGQSVEEIDAETARIRAETRKTYFLIGGVILVGLLWDMNRRRR